MTNEQYREKLKELGLSIIGAAPVFGISRRQAQRYASNDAIPPPIAKLMHIMVDCAIDPADVAYLK
jgi:hypothetical protein